MRLRPGLVECVGAHRRWIDHGMGLNYDLPVGTGEGREEFFGCGSQPMGSHFGVGAPPILVDFSGDWDVHCG